MVDSGTGTVEQQFALALSEALAGRIPKAIAHYQRAVRTAERPDLKRALEEIEKATMGERPDSAAVRNAVAQMRRNLKKRLG